MNLHTLLTQLNTITHLCENISQERRNYLYLMLPQ